MLDWRRSDLKAYIHNGDTKPEKVFLVGAELPDRSAWDVRDCLEELKELARTAGAEIVGEGIQKLQALSAGTFIGSGKAQEFSANCKAEEVDTVIFDDELSPAQTRNLEKIFNCKILDRTTLILDIFAQRARTREGKLQVELAQLQHLLPRLTRFWTHLSRQKGGIGMRGGEGETQLEVDRRKTQERIGRITQELELVRRQRATQRQGRQRQQWPLASIVGYTNAGKSTLLNALTGSGVLSEDKLFATLDPTTRRLHLPTNQDVLITDTVGFIRKLPHNLVESFKATLEEVVRADLLIHVVDASHPLADEQVDAVHSVLNEMNAAAKPTLMVFNKVDRLTNREGLEKVLDRHAHAVAVSAKTGEGFDRFVVLLGNLLRPVREYVELAIPHQDSAMIARLHTVGQVLEREYNGEEARFKARIPPHHLGPFKPYLRNGSGDAVSHVSGDRGKE